MSVITNGVELLRRERKACDRRGDSKCAPANREHRISTDRDVSSLGRCVGKRERVACVRLQSGPRFRVSK